MRLEKIKLAGFKSFVDPTTVRFPGNLSGIVGPNGCGKSNVIDAVRWVMGESSAKMLRGESMSDVIFNGSGSRKPVGLAGIELLFDNSDGQAGGEYARFGQIAVKRQVSRDGQSAYFLNGSRCRRRDIQDLFLGTGLGPRSYAIIEQGLISRFIEAKPEELRLFLEEAAGISKYKERRRETEQRIRHTRDNLSRLDDLRAEIAKQLRHLERQAATAEQYRRLVQDRQRLEAELEALRWCDLDREIGVRDTDVRTRETALEGLVTRQRRLEAGSEELRASYVAATDSFNEVQGHYYAAGSEIARTEQAIRFAKESRHRQQVEAERLERERGEMEDLRARDEQAMAEIEATLTKDEPEQETADAALAEALAEVKAAEAQLGAWEARWDDFNRRAAAPAELAQVERTHIDHLEQRLQQVRTRQGRVEEELGRQDTEALAARIQAGQGQVREHEERIADRQGRLRQLTTAGQEQERALRAVGGWLDEVRTELQSARGRQAALTALQEAALGDTDASIADWLRDQGLADAPRLADELAVEPGWERAVEAVLADRLRAVCTDSLNRVGAAAATAADLGALVLLETAAATGPTSPDSLLARVHCPWSLHGLLGSMRVVETLPEALHGREALASGECLVTRDGVLVGANWLRLPETDSALGGVLARAEALKESEDRVAHLEAQVWTREQEQREQRARRREIEEKREAVRAETAGLERSLADVRAELAGHRTRLEHQNERCTALEAERAELAERLEQTGIETTAARERRQGALDEIETLANRRRVLTEQRETLRDRVAQAREQERAARDRTHRLQIGIEAHRAAREAKLRSLEWARDQYGQLAERCADLRLSLEVSLEPLAGQERQLEEQLARRLDSEQQLGIARQEMEELDTRARALEQERHRVEQELDERRRELDALRLAHREQLVRRRTLEEQLATKGRKPSELLADLASEASVEAWQEQLEQVTARIAGLGNVNLASIDELAEQTERKGYLDAQHADITRSLDTLEQAIRRIDRETRGRFKDTFECVDQSFQQLFPRLFGGGRAYLALTGEDLLETGVTVMARPPGKCNANIHLLSGGEKALTAVALVFAIFQLNPAPFCMLDEVDAPLDDANVGRFCELVRSLSDRVQFIVITHNKLTMEVADHLLGVTMQEPGVSRLVAVDVDAAVGLTAE